MIYDHTICKLGEGPLWHPERAELFWFDILGKKLHRKGQSWDFPDHPSAAGWIDRETLLIATQTAFKRFDIETGAVEVLAPLEADNPVTRSNDGRADPMGGLWIGTMGLNAEKDAGAIYRFYKGELRQLFAPITISNAICFAPDGTTAYFCDTVDKTILRVRLDAQGWPKGEPELHIDMRGTGNPKPRHSCSTIERSLASTSGGALITSALVLLLASMDTLLRASSPVPSCSAPAMPLRMASISSACTYCR